MKQIGKLIVVSILCISLLCGAALADTSAGYVDPRWTFDLFVEALQAGRYEEALTLYREDEELLSNTSAIPEFPIFAEYAEGLLFLQNGQLDEALASFQRVHRIMVGNDENAVFPDREGLPDIAALITYTQARIAQRDGRLEDAISGYEKLRDYIHIRIFADVLARLGECDAQIKPSQVRYSIASSSANKNSISLSWNDSVDASEYLVSWKPVGAGNATTIGTDKTEVIAKNLLPNTTYRVTVIAKDDTQGSPLTATITTDRAQSLSGPITREERISLWTYEARRLNQYTIDEIRVDGWLSEPEKTEEGISIIRVDPYFAKGSNRYELHTVLRNTDNNRTDFTYTLVLRMPDEFGTYSLTNTESAPETKYSRGKKFGFDLTDLLRQYFSGQDGIWIENAGTIELYIDGMYVDAVPVTFVLD